VKLVRVIAGSARGTKLLYPKGAVIRPTSERVRESLFASLGPDVVGSHFCDLYAGGGSVGIEALSRGAASVVFVGRNRKCLKALRHNLTNTGLADRAIVVETDLPGSLAEVWQNSGPFGIIFADPPYSTNATRLLEAAAKLTVHSPDTLFLLQCDRHDAVDVPEFRQVKAQEFGDTVVLWYHRR